MLRDSEAWLAPATGSAFLNDVANHPAVRDWVAGPIKGELDLAPLLGDRDTHCLVGKHGFSVFRRFAPSVYEWHAATLPEGRGKWALNAGRASLDWLFGNTDAVGIVAPIPGRNRAARHLANALGFRLCSVAPAAWSMPGGAVSLHIYGLLRRDWRLKCQ